MPKVYNKRGDFIPSGAVYVGRPTKFGNPYVVPNDGDRSVVVQKFAEMLDGNPTLKAAVIRELKGKDLVCWCAPYECHADVLLEVANAET